MPGPNDSSLLRDNEQRQRQLETLDRLAQRFGASLSSAFAKNASEGKRLDEVLGKIESNVKLEGLLQEVLSNDEKVKALAQQMGIDTSAPEQEKS